MSLNKVILTVLEEQNILKTTKTKPIVDAIKNRKKISFYYSGPRKPKKDSVKPGKRIDAEAVALGLSKRGNLIMRAYVQPPSVSKKGFNKTGWRTFILSRMSNVEISDETFDSKRPQYKEGSDNSMSVTYVTSDWTKQPKVKKEKKPVQPTPKPTEPTVTPEKPTTTVTKPEVSTEPEKQELPQPKPEVKPEPIQKEPETSEPEKEELPEPKPEEKPSKNPEGEEEDKNLQESLRKIKRLMFS